jgi:hypothetical protein
MIKQIIMKALEKVGYKLITLSLIKKVNLSNPEDIERLKKIY